VNGILLKRVTLSFAKRLLEQGRAPTHPEFSGWLVHLPSIVSSRQLQSFRVAKLRSTAVIQHDSKEQHGAFSCCHVSCFLEPFECLLKHFRICSMGNATSSLCQLDICMKATISFNKKRQSGSRDSVDGLLLALEVAYDHIQNP
jgi:hypothetical protein